MSDSVGEALRDLLVALPLWKDANARRVFLEYVLHEHPALAGLHTDGDWFTVASELINLLARHGYQRLADGRHPGQALLDEVRKRPIYDESDIRTRAERLSHALAAPAEMLLGRARTRTLDALSATGRLDPDACPWPGLLAYDWGKDPDMARRFCGREEETAALLEAVLALADGGLLVVSGASGSGKSSLVKAGLWRALKEPTPEQAARVPDGRDWAVSTMTPSQGGDPFRALALSAAAVGPPGTEIHDDIEAERLRTRPGYLAALIPRVLGRRPRWLLILDQFEEIFAPRAESHREAFLAFLLATVAARHPGLRMVATIRSDFLNRLNDRTDLCVLIKRTAPEFVPPPDRAALSRIIEQPARNEGLEVAAELTRHLVREAYGQSGGLALLGAALQDLYGVGAASGRLTLDHYVKELGGLANILTRRAERGFEVLAARLGRDRDAAAEAALLARVFVPLVNVDDERTGEATRRRAPLACWPEDDREARAFIEVFAGTGAGEHEKVRLLVCGEEAREATVEVAHEALLRDWPLLADWIRQRAEGLVRRAEVLRDAARWDRAGRPDAFLPIPGVRRDTRRRLAAHGLLGQVREDAAAAHYLAEDDPDELIDLIRRAWTGRAAAPDPLPLLFTLTAPGRTWATMQRVGEWLRGDGAEPGANETDVAASPGIAERRLGMARTTRRAGARRSQARPDPRSVPGQRPLHQFRSYPAERGLTLWLARGLARVRRLLARDGGHDCERWYPRRLGIGDMLAVLGERRRGVGVCRDAPSLPDILWVTIPPGPFRWKEAGETRTIEQAYRIARYPVTNAQYLAFIEADDYGNPDWWQEGYLAPKPEDPRWEQPNRSRVNVAWVEAMAFCRWLTARYRAAGLIGEGEVIRLPTEFEWERAVRGTDGREYPWGAGYRPGWANVDETPGDPEGLYLRETTAVGLYPLGATPEGLCDCAGSVWEWCLNKYTNPEDVDTSGDTGRALRGGSWASAPASARAPARSWDDPNNRNDAVGLRLVCACPIPLYTESLNSEH